MRVHEDNTTASQRALGVPLIAGLVLLLALLASGADMRRSADTACATWGACSGWDYLTTPGDTIGRLHALTAAAVGIVSLGLAGYVRRLDKVRGQRSRSASMLILLVFLQGALLFIPATGADAAIANALHLGLTGVMLAIAVGMLVQPSVAVAALNQAQRVVARTAWPLTLGVFGVIVTGAYLASSQQDTCTSWPLCGTGSGDFNPLNAIVLHRGIVLLASALLLIALAAEFGATRLRGTRSLLLLGVTGVFGLEVVIGAFTTGDATTRTASALHFGLAGIAWTLLVSAARKRPHAEARTVSRPAAVLRDLFVVTKPGIMLLLLTTTFGAMLVAAAGWPGFGLMLVTLLGGALASGGASALNCYIDRDIDVVMSRTRGRPLPTGTLPPTAVLAFGLTLSVLAIVVLLVFVNPLAAVLALAGNLYYVGLYTLWLKRRTPQNIVIGGGAGAFPPLVGWAAVTGSLSLMPLVLFALIYYWTPPHFWALALLKTKDYARASVPMLPVTHGADITRRFMLQYAVLLLAICLLAIPAGAGWFYLGAAVVLNGLFLRDTWLLYREASNRVAYRLFRYSNIYLALVLLALAVDIALF